jgi:hypothetical protein
MLTRQNKLAIYGLLSQSFQKNSEYPLAKVALYLKDQGLNYEEYGYPKMKSLLGDLKEFLTLVTHDSEDHKRRNEFVVFHDYKENAGSFQPAMSQPHPQQTHSQPAPVNNVTVSHSSQPSHNGQKTVSKADQEKIYGLLKDHLDLHQEAPMAKVSKILLGHEVDYKALGFSKMKNLLSALPFIRLREVNLNGVPQALVSVVVKNNNTNPAQPARPNTNRRNPQASAQRHNPLPASNNNKPQTRPTPNAKPQVSHPAPSVKTTPAPTPAPTAPAAVHPIPVKEDPVFEEMEPKDISIPEKLILSLKETTGLGLDNGSFTDLIIEDLNSAIKSNTLVSREDAFLFPLSLKTKTGERLLGSFKEAAHGCSYGYYINFIGTDKEKPRDILKSQIHFDDYDAAVKSLADLAKKESWGYLHSKDPYIILKIYLQYTYYRIASQNKVMVDEQSGFASFNTGLVTPNYDDIYCVLLKNKDASIDETYLFQDFTVSGSQGFGKVIVEHFSPLPEKATYFEKPEDIYFDTTKPIHTDYNHIISDNLSRFPLDFLKTLIVSFPDENKLLTQIEKTNNDYARDRLFTKLEDDVIKNSTLFTILKACFDSAVETSLKMARYDFRTVLPSFFPTRNVMSMMLPLVFDKSKGPQAVLLVELTPSGNYQGQTILTLKQCYANARIIAPVENTFLRAEDIED